jgi:membrane protein DedA with SNARE-associated domain
MHLSAHALHHILATWGYVAVFAFVGIETIGIPVPGETMLILAAVYAGSGHLQIELVIAVAALGGILGDNIGYAIGRTGGRELALNFGHYIHVGPDRLAGAERFFEKHGSKTVFFGRFVALLRILTPFLAGVNRMHWPTFLVYNAAGAICWAVLYGMLAFELGKNLPLLNRVIRAMGIGGIALAVVVIAALIVIRIRTAKRMEAAVTGESETEVSGTEKTGTHS